MSKWKQMSSDIFKLCWNMKYRIETAALRRWGYGYVLALYNINLFIDTLLCSFDIIFGFIFVLMVNKFFSHLSHHTSSNWPWHVNTFILVSSCIETSSSMMLHHQASWWGCFWLWLTLNINHKTFRCVAETPNCFHLSFSREAVSLPLTQSY